MRKLPLFPSGRRFGILPKTNVCRSKIQALNILIMVPLSLVVDFQSDDRKVKSYNLFVTSFGLLTLFLPVFGYLCTFLGGCDAIAMAVVAARSSEVWINFLETPVVPVIVVRGLTELNRHKGSRRTCRNDIFCVD